MRQMIRNPQKRQVFGLDRLNEMQLALNLTFGLYGIPVESHGSVLIRHNSLYLFPKVTLQFLNTLCHKEKVHYFKVDT